MKINEVESIVGITKKNIRFYEEQGLIMPNRNSENGYRDYSAADVERLRQIKLLRKLSVPIDEIKRLQDGRLTLAECMEKHLARLNREQSNIDVIKELCARISCEVNELSAIDAVSYLEEMQKMEEGGMKFTDIKSEDIKKKKFGSAASAIVMIAFFAVMIAILFWAYREDPIPVGMFAFIILIFAAMIIGTIIALKQRFNEINGGEEDEARKY